MKQKKNPKQKQRPTLLTHLVPPITLLADNNILILRALLSSSAISD